MASEIVVTIFKVIAVAAPAVFFLLIALVVAGNHWLRLFVEKRKQAELGLSRLLAAIAETKLTDLETQEDCNRLLASLDDNERRVKKLLDEQDLDGEAEAEMLASLETIFQNRKLLHGYQQQIHTSLNEQSDMEQQAREYEGQLQKLREEMQEMERNYAPVALLVDRFMDYVTNGLKVVVTEPKAARRETVK